MEIMDKGYMLVPIILFVGGIIVSWNLGSLGIGLVEKNSKK